MHSNKLRALILLTTLGCGAMVCGWYATAPGLGISPDSTVYIGGARNLLAGRGLTIGGAPLTHFPPLLSVVLALGGWCGPDPAVVARWLNVVLLGANVFLLGYAIQRTTGAVGPAVLGGLLTLVAGDIVEVHTWAWSEPLMLGGGLAGLLLLGGYLEDPRCWRLVGAAACLALALLARYAAIPMIGTALLGILLFRRTRFRSRLWDVGVFTLVSCGPLGLWLVRNWWVAGSPTNRHFYQHWITAKHFNVARVTVAKWFYCGAGKLTVARQTNILFVALGVLLVLVGVLIWKTVRPTRTGAGEPRVPRLPWLLLIFGLSYFGFLVVSICFFDFNTPLDARILCPLHFALIAFTLCVLPIGCATYRWTRWVGVGLLIAGSWSVWPQGQRVQVTLADHHVNGRGYAHPKWRDCQFLERIRTLPAVPIYMNQAGGPAYFTGRSIQSVPAGRDSVTDQPNAKLAEQLQRMHDDLTTKQGVFIDLKVGGWPANLIPRTELFKALNLQSIEKTPEAEVFTICP